MLVCGCNAKTCTDVEDFGWRIGELTVKGPWSRARLISAFKTEDVVLALDGDFDDKFYLLLKEGTSCADDSQLKGFAPLVSGKATWSDLDKYQGPFSVCLCHDTVTGLLDPFRSPHQPPTLCENATNYALKVGQVFINGPILKDDSFPCRTGFICHVTIRWLALDSENIRGTWAKTRVYVQRVSCFQALSISGLPESLSFCVELHSKNSLAGLQICRRKTAVPPARFFSRMELSSVTLLSEIRFRPQIQRTPSPTKRENPSLCSTSR